MREGDMDGECESICWHPYTRRHWPIRSTHQGCFVFNSTPTSVRLPTSQPPGPLRVTLFLCPANLAGEDLLQPLWMIVKHAYRLATETRFYISFMSVKFIMTLPFYWEILYNFYQRINKTKIWIRLVYEDRTNYCYHYHIFCC